MGFGTALVWIDPNYFGSLCSNPNKIQTKDMDGGVIYFCLYNFTQVSSHANIDNLLGDSNHLDINEGLSSVQPSSFFFVTNPHYFYRRAPFKIQDSIEFRLFIRPLRLLGSIYLAYIHSTGTFYILCLKS